MVIPLTRSTPTPPGAATLPGLVAIFVAALIPLSTTPVLPLIDLYNHLARYFVLAHLDQTPALQHDYSAGWSLLPNIGLDVIVTALLGVLPQTLAAHVVVGLIFLVQFAGLLAFNRALTGRTSWLVAVLIVPLLYSFILNWGFANFLLGLGLVFATAAWWLRMRDRVAVALPVTLVAATAIFLTHGLAFALYGVLIVMLEFGLWLERRPRNPLMLVRALVPVAVQAVIPVFLFIRAAISHGGGGVSNAGASIARLSDSGALVGRLWSLVGYRLTTIVRVEEGPAYWFDLATFAVQITVVAWLMCRGLGRIVRIIRPAIVAGGLLVVIVPPAMFGVGYVADRMPLFLAFIILGGLDLDPGRDAVARAAKAMLIAVALVRLAAIAAMWHGYRKDYAEFDQIARLVPPGSLVTAATVGGSRHDDARRCDMYGPMLVSRHGAIAPLFADETQQPLRIVGHLRAALTSLSRALGPVTARDDNFAKVIAAAGPSGFEYVLLCHVNSLAVLPPGRLVRDTAHFALFRVGKAAT